ncbi:prenyltransferase/squalene oxidase repeat-containing protein [Microbispora sp. NPDC049125]|uniref:prenyltransferase/squalene oxidase repeat-containing protein n=1 Tax=Microbispora sp. NPDC049125 TaxID=3154929 RepID=UPI0034652EFF
MTTGALASPKAVDVAAAADDLVSDLMLRPWGTVSPSVYETARLVSLAPWLIGHRERLDFLLRTQQPDGHWGRPDGYGLVPTLSATEALLSSLGRPGRTDDEAMILAADLGLRWTLRRLAEDEGPAFPDTPAIELIVPSLIELVNGHLDRLEDAAVTPAVHQRLRLPASMSHRTLTAVRARMASGAALPEKLLHALEVVGDAARGAHNVLPSSIGTVGASPAATAAWINEDMPRDPEEAARRHLEAVVRRHDGPVPVGFPITVFERGWVLSWLARAGIPFDVPAEMLADLRAAIRPEGTAAGAGLPPDADTTSVALYALALLGMPCEPESLWTFETPTHFCTWQGEEGSSVSVNAHVLDAFGQYVAVRPAESARYAPAMEKISSWLRHQQGADGSWQDRWHASPYYATVACGLALHEFGGPASAVSVREAVRWVLGTQRPDGSWGRWAGTAEETAYAVQLLLLAADERRVEEAVTRGYRYLLCATDPADGPALWHDKDLYRPVAIVRAAVLAALHLVQSNRFVMKRCRQLRPSG